MVGAIMAAAGQDGNRGIGTVFEGFTVVDIETEGALIRTLRCGDGPPVLLLHGNPQTHVMWRKTAPRLAERFTVVATDLRGYGDSSKPPTDAEHLPYSKRAMALDQVQVMDALGFDRFAVVGHDRGGRVGHRMALDHPDRVSRAAFLDIVPTRTIFAATDQAVATGYYHWFFMIQGGNLPETLIGAEPEFYLRHKLGQWSGGDAVFEEEAVAEYLRCLRDPATIHASCEDYRAAAGIDLVHDEADLDKKIACPLLVLWGAEGLMERHFDVLATWRERADDVVGRAIPCGHFLAEERPEDTLAELIPFLGDPAT
jgi:haloacetate dehalogenase